MGRIVAAVAVMVCLVIAQLRELTAIVVDVSGSMHEHDFPAIQEQVCGRISTLSPGTILYVIPFAEEALDLFRVELVLDSFESRVNETQKYVKSLRAGGSKRGFKYGDFTNLCEGVDAGLLALAGEKIQGRRQIFLVSDGISQPDQYHKPVKLEDLAQKAKRLGVDLVLLDVSGTPVPDIEPELHNGLKIYRFPTPNLQVITPDSPGQWQLVWPVLDSLRGAWTETRTSPEPIRWWLIPGVAVVLVLVVWLLVSRKARQPTAEAMRKLLCVSVEKGPEQIYDLPRTVSVGSDPQDTLKIASAKPKELTLTADEAGVCRFQFRKADRDESGVVYGSRQFTLSCGAPVAVRVETKNVRGAGNKCRYFRVKGGIKCGHM